MSSGKRYPIDLHAHRSDTTGGVTMVLSSSDIPVSFAVEVVGDAIRINFLYPFATGEPTQTTRMDSVDFTVGQHSRRLFSVALNLPGMGVKTRRELEDKLRSALWHAFARLREGTAFGGPRLNYLCASEGLGIKPSESETPAWMADAVERMRLEQGSQSG
jgi:hypothetical protein